MNKLLALFVASAFALGSASGIAAEPAKKKEELSAEQKTEIRDRVERLKAERAKADAAKATTTTPAAPNNPQRTWPSEQRTNPSPERCNMRATLHRGSWISGPERQHVAAHGAATARGSRA